MPKAQADLPIPRERLSDPAARMRAREVLYRMLAKMGTVRNIRFGRDPLDGPLAEQGLPNDETAVIRAVADVTPHN